MTPTISNEQLLAAAEQYGTPLYVYDAATIAAQYHKLKEALSVLDSRIFFACKALTNLEVLRYINRLGCGADCSSSNEVQLALLAGFTPDRILYTSNGIAFAEIAEMVEKGVHVNIDSLSNLEKFGQRFGGRYPVGVRLRPNIMAGGNLKISTGHSKSKFGIPVEQLDELLRITDTYQLNIRTLHIHTGSDIKDADVFIRGLEVLFDLIPHFPRLQVLDLGGGFKVPYHPDEQETDVTQLGLKLRDALQQHETTRHRNLQVWFEPGKYLVSACGYLLTSVNVLKQNGDIQIAGTDTGLNHLIRPMMYDAYHHICNISNAHAPQHLYMVTGNVCETDTFADNRSLPEVREGDVLAICNAGAYGFEMSSNYNSRFRPAEVLFENDSFRLIRRRDTFEDLLRNQVVA